MDSLDRVCLSPIVCASIAPLFNLCHNAVRHHPVHGVVNNGNCVYFPENKRWYLRGTARHAGGIIPLDGQAQFA